MRYYPMSVWKTIKAPKALYLPVTRPGQDYKDSGRRVEPSDSIEILPGSHCIRINGVDLSLMIPTDSLRLDAQGVIQLDAPARPVALSSGGDGQAFVGRMGMGRALAATHTQDFSPPWTNGFQGEHTPLDDDIQGHFGTPQDNPFSEEDILKAFGEPEWIGLRDYPMRDGTTAKIRFDKRTGKDIGTPFRPYQASYDDKGRQVGSSVHYAGPKASFDMDDYRRKLAQQQAQASVAPTFREAQERHEQAHPKNAPKVAGVPIPPPAISPPTPGISSSAPLIDQMLQAASGALGFSPGSLIHLTGDEALRTRLVASMGALEAPSLELAISKLFMAKGNPRIIAVQMDSFDKAALADELPAASDAFKGSQTPALLVISTPDAGENTPRLISFFCQYHLNLQPHERDPRFMTVSFRDQHTTCPIPG